MPRSQFPSAYDVIFSTAVSLLIVLLVLSMVNRFLNGG